jgi:membrane protein implicated in regulation of membrane protease activity
LDDKTQPIAGLKEQNLSFDEFKLYYDSTEKVTDRRIETNRWNYSVCVAMLIAVAVLARWALSTTDLLWVGLSAIAILCIMAVLFCALWVGQIRDFKKLNNAKFEVLNEMAPAIEFNPEARGVVISYRPFEKEWTKLSKLNALDEIRSSNIIALKSSNVEYFIPKAFALLFGSILVVLIVVVILDWPPTRLAQPQVQPSTSSVPSAKHP